MWRKHELLKITSSRGLKTKENEQYLKASWHERETTLLMTIERRRNYTRKSMDKAHSIPEQKKDWGHPQHNSMAGWCPINRLCTTCFVAVLLLFPFSGNMQLLRWHNEYSTFCLWCDYCLYFLLWITIVSLQLGLIDGERTQQNRTKFSDFMRRFL